METYVCVHDPAVYFHKALQTALEGHCLDARVTWVGRDRSRETYRVETEDDQSLLCWLADLNTECPQACVHPASSPQDTDACARYRSPDGPGVPTT